MALFIIGLLELLLGSLFTELIAVFASSVIGAAGIGDVVTGLTTLPNLTGG